VTSSAIYDARQHATPSQLRALKERNERRSWVDRLAKQDNPVSCQSASARNAALPDTPKKLLGDLPPTTFAEAFAKAEMEHPLDGQFSTWFGVVGEAKSSNGYATIEQIQRATVEQFPIISVRDIRSVRRMKEVILPRHIAMYIAKSLTLKSLTEIGRMFGGRDHTTVLNAVRKIERLIKSDPALAQDVGEIINNLGCRDI
jgi:hypothetical protein